MTNTRCLVGNAVYELNVEGGDAASARAFRDWTSWCGADASTPSDWIITTTLADVKPGFYDKEDRLAGICLPGLKVCNERNRVEFNIAESAFRSGRWGVPFTYFHALLGGMVSRFQGSQTRLLHGGAVQVAPGEAVAVVGASGAGKSTLCRALGPCQLGDEAICIEISDQKAAICGTPIPGELRAADCDWRQLRAILIPGEHKTERIEFLRLSRAESAKTLLSTVVCLQGDDRSADLAWIDGVTKNVPVYKVHWWKERNFPLGVLREILE